MKSHPLIEAARAVGTDHHLMITALDALHGVGQDIIDRHNQLADAIDALPDEPLAIVPCAWLVEIADMYWPDIGLLPANPTHEKYRDMAAKLRRAVGEG